MIRLIVAIWAAVAYGHVVGYKTAWLRGMHCFSHKTKGSVLVKRYICEESEKSDRYFATVVELRRCKCGWEFATSKINVRDLIGIEDND